jgi:hypothetical protein
MGLKELQQQLKKYHFEVPYGRFFRGKEKALVIIYGKWDDSYKIVPTYQAELLKSMPGSVVEYDTEDSLLLLNHVLMVSYKVVDLA